MRSSTSAVVISESFPVLRDGTHTVYPSGTRVFVRMYGFWHHGAKAMKYVPQKVIKSV